MLKGKRIAVTAGKKIRDYLHVEDVASALIAVAFSEFEGAVNVGSGQPVSVRELVETIARSIGGESLVDFGARPANLLDPPYIVAENSLLTKKIGWKAKFSLIEGIENTIAWWRNRI